MNSILFKIKDECRQNLCKYLLQAISVLPPFEKTIILDLGCGTGVPTLTLAKYYKGVIFTIDTDKKALDCLVSKLTTQVVSSIIIVECKSAYEIDFPNNNFDIVLAEGLLNIIGFENGLRLVNKNLKQNGYFIIHDEFKNHIDKLEIIKCEGYEITKTIKLGKDIWWNEYYKVLEEKIVALDSESQKEFENELNEIELCKKQPEKFNSIYYIVKKTANQSVNQLIN